MSTRARHLRANSSPIERHMWRLLYAFRTGGYHFRKQVPIGPYTVDMACHHAKLVIEVDGDTHGFQEDYDRARTVFFEEQGYRVIRFANLDVMTNMEGVLEQLALFVGRAPLPTLSPEGERAI